MKTTTCTFALLVLAAPGLLSGCNTGDASPIAANAEDDATPVPVQVRMPLRGDLFATYETTANITTEGDAPVVARVAGDVVELLVEEGARVTAGQALARLDGERLRLEMLAAKADRDRVQGEFDRYQDLVSRGLVSKAAFDNLQYDLDAIRATYELRKLEYDYTTLRAPIDGQVATRNIRPGQNVAANDVAFRITDTGQLAAELDIPQTELSRIRAGQSATLMVDSMPGREFPAEIVRISPTVDMENGTFRARAEFDNASGELAPGMFARFSIAYEHHPDALLIPHDALLEEDEETAVYVVAGDTVERRVIRTGIVNRGKIEVLDGLDESDQVVVTGHSSLREGSHVLARLGNPELHSG
jgi:membrane fusion protein, multidrug efflux system